MIIIFIPLGMIEPPPAWQEVSDKKHMLIYSDLSWFIGIANSNHKLHYPRFGTWVFDAKIYYEPFETYYFSNYNLSVVTASHLGILTREYKKAGDIIVDYLLASNKNEPL